MMNVLKWDEWRELEICLHKVRGVAHRILGNYSGVNYPRIIVYGCPLSCFACRINEDTVVSVIH
jgi:hypothetical protein